MITFDELSFSPHPNDPEHGLRALVYFPNRYGASVIRMYCSIGHDKGLWEVGVMRCDPDGYCGLTEESGLGDDGTIGNLDESEVNELLARIAALPLAF